MHTPKTILITGATSGIGHNAAFYLARRGHHVIATGRRVEKLESIQTRAKKEGLRIDTHRLDVTKPESIHQLMTAVEQITNGAGLDVLVNNAGYGHLGPVELISDTDVRRQFDTNVFGLMAMIRASIPMMRQRGGGRIVNVSSIGGRVTSPLMGVYNATKYAVESLSDALRVELAPWNIHVVLVEPGPIRTEFGATSLGLSQQYNAVDNPYAPLLLKADAMSAQFEKNAVEPGVVSRAIARASEARKPRPRYVAPGWSKLAVLAVRILPTRVVDFVLARALGFHKLAVHPKQPALTA